MDRGTEVTTGVDEVVRFVDVTLEVVETEAVVEGLAVVVLVVKAEVDSFVVSTVVGPPVALGERGAGD